MKLRSLLSFSLAAISAGALLYGCAEGGGGGASTSPASTRTSSATVKSVASAFGASSGGIGKADPASGDSSGGLVNRLFDQLKSVASSPGGFKKPHALGTIVINPCPGGSGSKEITTTGDQTSGSITTVANNCVLTKVGSVEQYIHGTEKISFTSNSFSIETTGFSEGEQEVTASGTIKIREETSTGTFSISNVQFATGCETEFIITAGTMSANVSFTEYKDEDRNGTAEVNEVFTMSNFTTSAAQEHSTCTVTKVTFVANGGMSFTDNLVSSGENNFSATFTNFTDVATEVSGGTSVTVSGTVAVTTNCESGTYTVSTITPLFFPDTGDESCPTSGKILVEGGGATVAVIFTSTGGIEIDEGNDGTVEKTFADCDDADVCKV